MKIFSSHTDIGKIKYHEHDMLHKRYLSAEGGGRSAFTASMFAIMLDLNALVSSIHA